MARPRKIDRPVGKTIHFPQSLAVQVDLMLYSEVEGRVPLGAWQKYLCELIKADMEKRNAQQGQ